jgi:hypothetical protein
LLDGSGVEEVTMGFEVGGEQRNAIRGWVCGRWGHAVFKVSWGRQIVSAKMGGRVEKKRWEQKFSVHTWREQKTFIVNLMEKKRRERNGRFTSGDCL